MYLLECLKLNEQSAYTHTAGEHGACASLQQHRAENHLWMMLDIAFTHSTFCTFTFQPRNGCDYVNTLSTSLSQSVEDMNEYSPFMKGKTQIHKYFPRNAPSFNTYHYYCQVMENLTHFADRFIRTLHLKDLNLAVLYVMTELLFKFVYLAHKLVSCMQRKIDLHVKR